MGVCCGNVESQCVNGCRCDYLLGGLIVEFANAVVTPVREEAACKEQVLLFEERGVVVL